MWKIIMAVTLVNVFSWVLSLILLVQIIISIWNGESIWVGFLFISGVLLQIPAINIHQKFINLIASEDQTQDEVKQKKIQLTIKSIYLLPFTLTNVSILFLNLFYSSKVIGLSYIGLFLSIIIVVWILYISSIIYSKDRIARSIKIDFSIVIFFLGVFISLSNILAITIGVYDKAKDNTTLYYDNISNNLENSNTKLNSKDSLLTIGDSTTIKTSDLRKRIWFDEGSSIIKKDTSKEIIEKIEEEIELIKNKDEVIKILPKCFLKANYQYLFIVADIVKNLSRGEFNRLRITLMGHASNEPLIEQGTRYKSNYELSLSRVQTVQQFLLENIKEYNIEWSLIPLSNEDYFQLTRNHLPPKHTVDKRSVEIIVEYIQEHYTTNMIKSYKVKNSLTLLDYAYFMMYTITTTGYGDIKPVDSYIKFVVSIANIYEIIFLVVFFNVLLSKRRDE